MLALDHSTAKKLDEYTDAQQRVDVADIDVKQFPSKRSSAASLPPPGRGEGH